MKAVHLRYLADDLRAVRGVGVFQQGTLSGSESLSAAANIFMGQTEAPLLVRPFIKNMTQSELHCLMVGGMATIAGSVLGAYVSFLGGGDPAQQAKFATYLLSASTHECPGSYRVGKTIYARNRTREN